jgi:hypothetical protein
MANSGGSASGAAAPVAAQYKRIGPIQADHVSTFSHHRVPASRPAAVRPLAVSASRGLAVSAFSRPLWSWTCGGAGPASPPSVVARSCPAQPPSRVQEAIGSCLPHPVTLTAHWYPADSRRAQKPHCPSHRSPKTWSIAETSRKRSSAASLPDQAPGKASFG